MTPDEAISVSLEDLRDEVSRSGECRVEAVASEVLCDRGNRRRAGRVLRERHDVNLDPLAILHPEAFGIAGVAFTHHEFRRLRRVVLVGVSHRQDVRHLVVILLHRRVERPRQLSLDRASTEAELDDLVAVD